MKVTLAVTSLPVSAQLLSHISGLPSEVDKEKSNN